MIGVPWNVPKLPGFVIVNVPPWTSSGSSFFVRARWRYPGSRVPAGEVQVLRVVDDGDDEALALVECHGDAEIDERASDDALAGGAVHPGIVLQRVDRARAMNPR